MSSFQRSVISWLINCFGMKIARDKIERNHRFIEEALELVQATGCTMTYVDMYIDNVFKNKETSAPYNTFPLDLPAGSHTYKAVAVDSCGNTAEASTTFTTPVTTPTTKKCDFNNDTKVDSNDLFILLANFNKTVTINTKGDCNSTSTVDTNDLFILLAGYGK